MREEDLILYREHGCTFEVEGGPSTIRNAVKLVLDVVMPSDEGEPEIWRVEMKITLCEEELGARGGGGAEVKS